MEKFNKVISTIEKFDLSEIANDKLVVCLAFIGFAATVKTLWSPFNKYVLRRSDKVTRASHLKIKYGGQWAMVTDGTEETGQHLARELAKEGFNIVLINRGQNDIDDFAKLLQRKYGIEARVIEYDVSKVMNMQVLNDFDTIVQALEEDICIIVNNNKYTSRDQ